MKKLLAHTYYQGEARITQHYEWDETENFPAVLFVTYKDGHFCQSEDSGLTPDQATAYIADLSKRNQIRDEFMMA